MTPTVVRLSPALLAVALLASLAATASGCAQGRTADALFTRLDPAQTGVAFENTLAESPEFNIVNYLYYFNGGGVAAGDVDGDGLPDLYFTANEGPNALYLNRTEPGGPVRFEDATEAAGVAGTSEWTTGVTMADVDADGRLDLYVSALGGVNARRGRNELFLNEGTGPDGVPRFREAAAEVGLDFEGYGTQATFFDYDRDGDLDVYLLNHAVHSNRGYSSLDQARQRDEQSGDRLYRNDGAPGALPQFVEVTEQAGILSGVAGYGLSVVASDIDGDGWPDLYVGNDFHENDFLYLNNADGTFREVSNTSLPHTSRFSMGADAADVDGDGQTDVVVLDMLPKREAIRAVSGGEESRDQAALKAGIGYLPQVARNTLQINRGTAPDGRPRFSDLAYLAGIEATDWSWSALLADLDLDGWRDLYVTNGIWRRPNDLDFIAYASAAHIQRDLNEGISPENLGLFERMPQVPVPNEAFRGGPGVRFSDVGVAWGLADEGYSNGATTVDLDNDGDLDLVVNNVNAPASVYLNGAAERGATALEITLEGEGGNTAGLGSKVTVTTDSLRQTAELSPTRGFLSSVDPRLVVGLGGATRAATVRVVWPDGRTQTLTDVVAGALTLRQSDAGPGDDAPAAARPPLLTDVTAALGVTWTHRETVFEDFDREPFMPHGVSTLGPALAVGDVDGDGLDDVWVGGAKTQPSALFRQTAGGFVATDAGPWRADSLSEDVVAEFFDADGDGDLDLYVGTAGNEFWGQSETLRDRLYLGDGAGGFQKAPAGALPDLFVQTGTVAPADVDGDGDTDLFVGGRVVAKAYGTAAQSALLINDGRGRFTDATGEWAPKLARVGMVSSAAWADLDGDGRPDLALAGEWMAPTVFRNNGRALAEAGGGLGDARGWWTALAAADLDGDGDVDLALGNLGLNSSVRATPEHPARLWLADFDDNTIPDALFTTYRDGDDYPIVPVSTLQRRFPELRKRWPSATAFGIRTPSDLFGRRAGAADQRTATTFASVVAINDGEGGFTLRPLPDLAQAEPVYALLADDLDGDGAADLMLGGGLLNLPPERGRYDAGYGLVLHGSSGRFRPVSIAESGLAVSGEIRAIRHARGPSGTRLVIVGQSNGPLRVFQRGRAAAPTAAASGAGR